jgi:KipI family sensor histidine kinase inhibitor
VDLLGDAALLVTLGDAFDAATNERVMSLAASLRAEPLGLQATDIVPAISSLAVYFAPGAPLDRVAAELAGRASRLEERPGADASATLHDIPVRYGGEDGPDLHDVAAFAGMTAADVIDCHASRIYRVYMLGFLPGFAYLGEVDDVIAAPRRASPRQTVPAGSVGIAGRQTGVYPQVSPGGWQLI